MSVAYDTAYFVAIVTSLWAIARFGKRDYLTASLAAYAAGCAACALAPSVAIFSAGRVLAGAALGGFFTSALLTLVATAPKRDLPVAMTLFSAVTLGAPIAAPLYAGVVLEHAGWRAIFAGIAAIATLAAATTGLRMRDVRSTDARTFDATAFVALLVGTVAFISITDTRAVVWLLVGAGVTIVAVTVFARREWQAAGTALCDLRVLRQPVIARGLLAGVLLGTLIQSGNYEARFVHVAFALGPTQTGLLLISRLLGVALGVGILAWLAARGTLATRTMAAGLLFLAATFIARSFAAAFHGSVPLSAAIGVGETTAFACVLGPLASTLFTVVDRSQFASLVVFFKLSTLLGAGIGLAIVSAAFGVADASHVTTAASYCALWSAMAAVAALTAVLSTALRIPAARASAAS